MDGLERSETQTTSHISEMDPQQSDEVATGKQTWSQDSRLKESITEWTDEKHRLYLKSMEASFVNQLFNSMDIPGWNSLKGNDVASSRQIRRTPSSQFKVLRGGCWKKVNFERPEFQLNKAHDTHSFLASPWIRHFKSECKPKDLAPANPPEVSDQNFIDEEFNGEEGSSICISKKMKTQISESSSHDQVVPLPPNQASLTENSP